MSIGREGWPDIACGRLSGVKRAACVCCCLLLLAVSRALASAPRSIGFSGSVARSGSTAYPDGNYAIRLTLYDAPSGGTVLWTDTRTLAVVKGVFNAILGDEASNPIPDSVRFDAPYYVGVRIGLSAASLDAEMSPRLPLRAVPYALFAHNVADNSISSSQLATDPNSLAKLSGGTMNPTAFLFGDSVSCGAGASAPANAFASIVAASNGWVVSSSAMSGTVLNEQLEGVSCYGADQNRPAILNRVVGPEDRSFTLTGLNDLKTYGLDRQRVAQYREQLRAALVWLAIPASRKLDTTDSAIAYQGKWTAATDTRWGGDPLSFGKTAAAIGAKASVTVSGRAVYVGFVRSKSGGLFNLQVDGILRGQFSCGGAMGTAVYPNLPSPGVARVGGLADGPHVVTVTTVSASPVTVFLFAGSNAACGPDGPYCYVGNCLRYSFASDDALAMYNDAISTTCAELASDGLGVVYVDANAFYTPATDVSPDYLHPNDLGHFHIAQAFKAATGSLVTPIIRQQAASLPARAPSDVAGTVTVPAGSSSATIPQFVRLYPSVPSVTLTPTQDIEVAGVHRFWVRGTTGNFTVLLDAPATIALTFNYAVAG